MNIIDNDFIINYKQKNTKSILDKSFGIKDLDTRPYQTDYILYMCPEKKLRHKEITPESIQLHGTILGGITEFLYSTNKDGLTEVYYKRIISDKKTKSIDNFHLLIISDSKYRIIPYLRNKNDDIIILNEPELTITHNYYTYVQPEFGTLNQYT